MVPPSSSCNASFSCVSSLSSIGAMDDHLLFSYPSHCHAKSLHLCRFSHPPSLIFLQGGHVQFYLELRLGFCMVFVLSVRCSISPTVLVLCTVLRQTACGVFILRFFVLFRPRWNQTSICSLRDLFIASGLNLTLYFLAVLNHSL